MKHRNSSVRYDDYEYYDSIIRKQRIDLLYLMTKTHKNDDGFFFTILDFQKRKKAEMDSSPTYN